MSGTKIVITKYRAAPKQNLQLRSIIIIIIHVAFIGWSTGDCRSHERPRTPVDFFLDVEWRDIRFNCLGKV